MTLQAVSKYTRNNNLLAYNIFIHIPCLLTEVHAHLYKAFSFQYIRYQITFLINLLQRLFSTAVQFKFNNSFFP